MQAEIGNMAAWQGQQGCFTVKPAIIEPVGVVHGHPLAAAAVLNLHQKPVFARADGLIGINKKRGRAAAMAAYKLIVEENARFILGGTKAQNICFRV